MDHVWDWGEQRLVHVDLGVSVDAVIADVKELDDLGFWELFDDALAGALILDQLTGNLHKKRDIVSNNIPDLSERRVAWEPTFFIDLIRGFD